MFVLGEFEAPRRNALTAEQKCGETDAVMMRAWLDLSQRWDQPTIKQGYCYEQAAHFYLRRHA